MKKLLLQSCLIFVLCGCNQSGPLTIEKTCSEFDKIDADMLGLIDKIQLQHSDDKAFLSKFNMEQVYWIQYRDAHLKALYPQNWDRYYRKEFGKEVFNPCKCDEMIRFTKQRIQELNVWLSGDPANQKDCPSSRK